MFHIPPAMWPYSKSSEPNIRQWNDILLHQSRGDRICLQQYYLCEAFVTRCYVHSFSMKLQARHITPAHAPPMCHSITINIEVHPYVKSCLYHVRTCMLRLAAIASCLSLLVGFRHRNQIKKHFHAPTAACVAVEPRQQLWTNRCPLCYF